MTVAKEMFRRDGYGVFGYAMEGTRGGEEHLMLCDAVILPMPCTFDGETVFAPLSAETVTLGEINCVSDSVPVLCGGKPKGFERFISYYDDALQTANAAPTAEAAIAIAIDNTDRVLMQCRALITGGGKVAKALAQRLIALGCRVTVAARKPADRAFFDSLYCETCDIDGIKDAVKSADLIFNTVPDRIMTAERAEAVRRGTPLIELASSPFCITPEGAAACGIRLIKAPGLPGKYFHVTAGEAIYRRIKEMIEREHIL